LVWEHCLPHDSPPQRYRRYLLAFRCTASIMFAAKACSFFWHRQFATAGAGWCGIYGGLEKHSSTRQTGPAAFRRLTVHAHVVGGNVLVHFQASWWLYTPLQYAAFHDPSATVVEALLEQSSDVNNMGALQVGDVTNSNLSARLCSTTLVLPRLCRPYSCWFSLV
jgi:hypothetical protein